MDVEHNSACSLPSPEDGSVEADNYLLLLRLQAQNTKVAISSARGMPSDQLFFTSSNTGDLNIDKRNETNCR